jgi:hypothetical protein
MDDDFEYDDFMDMMEEDEISYRDEYRNQARGDEDAFTD